MNTSSSDGATGRTHLMGYALFLARNGRNDEARVMSERAAGIVHVAVRVEQHAAEYVGTLVDIVEEKRAETGLVAD